MVDESNSPKADVVAGAHLLLTAIEQTPDTIFITDAKGNIEYVNSSFEKVTGYTREEVIGKNPRMLKSGLHPPEYYRSMWDTLSQGRVWKGTVQNRRKDGTLFTEEVSISPVRNHKGETTNYVAVKRDITAQLALERQLRQSQKMEALGALAGGIAHDFNNLLTAILGYTEMAQSELEESSPLRSDLDNVLKAAQRARELVTQIHGFGKQEDERRSTVRIGFVLEEALRIVTAGLPPMIVLDTRIEHDCGNVLADPIQLQQVLMNLCTNAYHTLADQRGRILVELRPVDVDEAMAEAWPELHAGPYALLSVEDNGSGIQPEHVSRVFDPFFSTKAVDSGTGLGLALSYGIVKAHGGTIKVYSEPGRGTRFHVYLPVIQEAVTQAGENLAEIHGGKECILVVDDEEEITKILARQLERLGYTVVRCTRPEDAMLVLRRQPHIFDAVISDQTMPGITGTEIAKEVHTIRPDLPVILSSGLVTPLDAALLKEAHVAAFLPKPVETARLAKVLREILDSKHAI
jgi:PAS domain S-box-containing protein